MPRGNSILEQTLDTQRRIGRLAQHDHGLTLKGIAHDSGVPYSTVCSYFTQERDVRPAEIPMSNYIRFIGVIPDELLSQLLEPADRHLEVNGDSDDDYDDLAEAASEVEREVRRARHPKSPGGVEIIAIEEERIRRKARNLGRRKAA